MGKGQELYKRAKQIIPGGTMLLSKRPEQFLPENWPAYYSRSKGCRIWDLDGKEYIDCSMMGIGTNTLGYANEEVDEAVMKVVCNGNLTTLNCPEEVYLAEKLIELDSWAGGVRYTRGGGEANSVCIRIARAATGKDKVAICGYHGWHDWYVSVNLGDSDALAGHLLPGIPPAGVPKGLRGSTIPFRYNSFEELLNIVNNNDLSEGKMFFNNTNKRNGEYLTSEEQCVARWAYENGQRAGVTTTHFSSAKCLYLSIRSGESVYGVIGIPVKKDAMDSFEYSILLSVINECALAMENSQNAIEKEKTAILAKNEQLRSDLLRAISHDLRTPLCSISGNADMLLNNERCLDDITKQQIYTDIYDDAEWLIGVVENLLSVTRLNDGRLKIKFTDQLLDEVIAESLRHISRKHDAYKIQVECEELILAHMDVRLIIQVLVNLIDNAIKYTPQGSTICIRGLRTDGRAQISVEDNGPGIADEMKSHIFEMFYTGKTTIADSHRSLGLGLALCHSIIEAHEGELTLKDNYPHGCIFVFTLPLSEVTLNE